MLQNVFKSLCTKFSQCEYHANYSHQMPDFSLKMHQIQCRLGLRPRPRWGSLQRSHTPSWTWGGKGRMKGREGKRKERGRGRRGGREGEWWSPCQNPRSATEGNHSEYTTFNVVYYRCALVQIQHRTSHMIRYAQKPRLTGNQLTLPYETGTENHDKKEQKTTTTKNQGKKLWEWVKAVPWVPSVYCGTGSRTDTDSSIVHLLFSNTLVTVRRQQYSVCLAMLSEPERRPSVNRYDYCYYCRRNQTIHRNDHNWPLINLNHTRTTQASQTTQVLKVIQGPRSLKR